jgi:hypothetical protein
LPFGAGCLSLRSTGCDLAQFLRLQTATDMMIKVQPKAIGQSKITTDPSWYKSAVIYQLHVKSFYDYNEDGIGDFAGLVALAPSSEM